MASNLPKKIEKQITTLLIGCYLSIFVGVAIPLYGNVTARSGNLRLNHSVPTLSQQHGGELHSGDYPEREQTTKLHYIVCTSKYAEFKVLQYIDSYIL